jgi:hypothetical protein
MTGGKIWTGTSKIYKTAAIPLGGSEENRIEK